MFEQSVRIPARLGWGPEFALRHHVKNKAQQMFGQEGKGADRRAGIWLQVNAINTILWSCGLDNITHEGLCPLASTQPWPGYDLKGRHCIKERKEEGKGRAGPELPSCPPFHCSIHLDWALLNLRHPCSDSCASTIRSLQTGRLCLVCPQI